MEMYVEKANAQTIYAAKMLQIIVDAKQEVANAKANNMVIYAEPEIITVLDHVMPASKR